MAKRPTGLPTRPRKTPKPKGLFAYALAGLSKVGNKARQWLDNLTGQTISYNKGRERIAAQATSTPEIKAFELALAKSGGNVQYAKEMSGISDRKFKACRKSSASSFVKEKGRFKIPTRKGKVILQTRFHAFIGTNGLPNYDVGLAGNDLLWMRRVRAAIEKRDQQALNKLKQERPNGITDRYGVTHHPETSLRKLNAAKRRMTPEQRDFFSSREWYQTTDKSDARAA